MELAEPVEEGIMTRAKTRRCQNYQELEGEQLLENQGGQQVQGYQGPGAPQTQLLGYQGPEGGDQFGYHGPQEMDPPPGEDEVGPFPKGSAGRDNQPQVGGIPTNQSLAAINMSSEENLLAIQFFRSLDLIPVRRRIPRAAVLRSRSRSPISTHQRFVGHFHDATSSDPHESLIRRLAVNRSDLQRPPGSSSSNSNGHGPQF